MIVYYVINLDRRPDRRLSLLTHLGPQELRIKRVSAVDGRDGSPDTPNTSLSSGEEGCWASHRKVMKEFLDSGQEYCVVLEDDAQLIPKSEVQLGPVVKSLIQLMKDENLGVLQIGTIPRLYSLKSSHGLGFMLAEAITGVRSKEVRISGLRQRFYKHQYRAGTHAYLISRKSAKVLHASNNPPLFPADSFFSCLAKINVRESAKETLWFGTLYPGFFEQTSRSAGMNLDSDVSTSHTRVVI